MFLHALPARTRVACAVLLLVASAGALAGAQPPSPAEAIAGWIALPAPPGTEQAVAGGLARALPGWTADRWGNLVRTVGRGRPRRVVACALDQSAYVVSQVTDEGYLRVRRTGTPRHPLHDQFHEAQRVQVVTARGLHPGVVAVPNGHFARQHIADSSALSFDDLWVDVGAASRAEVGQLGIALMDPVALDRPAWAFAGHAAGPNAGARAACAAVVAVAEAAAQAGVTAGETQFVLSTQRIFGWVGLSTHLAAQGGAEAIALVDDGRGERSVGAWAPAALPRAYRALDGRVGADSVHVFAPAVRFPASPVETIATDEAEALLAWVRARAAVRGTGPDAWRAVPAGVLTADPARATNRRHAALADRFLALADLPGVPGHEQRVREALLAAMPAWARAKARVDSAGNLVIALGPARDTGGVAFLAHMDEVGFEVDRILADGQVTLRRLGGAVLSSWEGVPALLHVDDSGARPPLRGLFVPRSNGSTKTPDRLTAWFGLDSAGLVRAGVRAGMSITAFKQATRLAGARVTARGSDDRTGSTALLAALARVDTARVTRPTWFVWTVREEGGLNGARAFGDTRLPGRDVRIGQTLACVYSIDTFVSSDTPLESPHFAYAPLGAGPVLRALDDGNLVPRAERERILALARAANLPVQLGTTQGSTDGGAVSPWGPFNIGLSWPGRYSHGPAEVLDLRDVETLVRLIVVVAQAR
jgi:putative aminopeptidase FrvX